MSFKMSYFPPHFMMAGRQDMPENLVSNGASAYAAAAKHVSNPWWLNYDQALDLQAPQQHKPMQTVGIFTVEKILHRLQERLGEQNGGTNRNELGDE